MRKKVMSRIIKIVQVFIGVIIGLCGLFLCAASIGVGVSVILFALMFIPAVRRQVRKIPFIGNKKDCYM